MSGWLSKKQDIVRVSKFRTVKRSRTVFFTRYLPRNDVMLLNLRLGVCVCGVNGRGGGGWVCGKVLKFGENHVKTFCVSFFLA